MNRILAPLALVFALALTEAAEAHPHIFIDASAEVVFDQNGQIAAVRNIWRFDKAWAAFVTQGLDANNDGKLSDAELQPMAKTNVEALAQYDFFTYLTVQGKTVAFVPPSDYGLTASADGGLVLTFTLPLKAPVASGGTSTLVIFDRDYFVALTFPKDNPLKLVGAPAACTSTFRPPQYLGDTVMSMLLAIPADEHDLPPELASIVTSLANSFQLSCP